MRVRLKCLLLLLPVTLAASPAPVEDVTTECTPQEVVRSARRTLTVFAEPRLGSDSVGFISKDYAVPVLACGRGWCQVKAPLFEGYVIDTLLASGAPGAVATPSRAANPTPAAAPAAERRCCRICTTGKACGNSCIARNRTCRQPPGCACNG